MTTSVQMYVCTSGSKSPINDMTKVARPPTSSADLADRSKEAGQDGAVGRRGRLQDFCSGGWGICPCCRRGGVPLTVCTSVSYPAPVISSDDRRNINPVSVLQMAETPLL